MRNSFFLYFLLLVQVSFSQEKMIRGKVVANGNYTEGIHVINIVNEKATITDEKGEFQVLVKEGDLLVFSGTNFEYKRKIIASKDFESKEITIEMIPSATQLDEVVIEKHPGFDAVELGILESPAKKYTPAERRLQTAGDFKPIHLLGLLAGSLQVDPILNAINGKTKRLKKEILLERNEAYLKKLDGLHSDEYFASSLGIPEIQVEGFKYFCIEDKAFIDFLYQGNKPEIEKKLLTLAEEYLNLQNEK